MNTKSIIDLMHQTGTDHETKTLQSTSLNLNRVDLNEPNDSKQENQPAEAYPVGKPLINRNFLAEYASNPSLEHYGLSSEGKSSIDDVQSQVLH